MRIASASALLFLALCLTAQATAQVVYVDQNAPGPGHDGLTWDTAFLTIQAGISAATPGGEVWVANGTYYENVAMGNGVWAYGGFLGAEPGGYETSLDQRDFEINITLIDASLSGSCVTVASNSRVDGFTITRGSAERGGGFYCRNLGAGVVIANCLIESNTAVYYGGGAYCHGASPTITNCTFSNNSVTDGVMGSHESYGGGLYVQDASPYVAFCTFVGNTSSWEGGGMFSWEGAAQVVDCLFTDNHSDDGTGASYGGGMCNENSTTLVANCQFIGNTTGTMGSRGSGGGMSNWCEPGYAGGAPTITDCTFTANVSTIEGGGMYNGFTGATSPTVTNCDFTENVCDDGVDVGWGGGMYNEYSSPTVTDCTFTGNTAHRQGGGMSNFWDPRFPELEPTAPVVSGCAFEDNYAMDGGGMENENAYPHVSDCTFTNNETQNDGPGMCNWTNYGYAGPYAVVTYCDFTGNSGRDGGGMYSEEYSPTVLGCHFTGNTVRGHGGGMYNEKCATEVTDCTFTSNSSQETGGGLGVYADPDYAGPSPIVTRCRFEGNTTVWAGGGLECNDTGATGPTVTGCTFINNAVDSGSELGWGGGMGISQSAPTVTDCEFTGNTSAHQGGGISTWGDPDTGPWTPIITGCTFTGNTAVEGGGMSNVLYSAQVTNCTFTDNTADDGEAYGVGGGMYNEDSATEVSDCTFTGNFAVWDGGGMQIRNCSPIVTNCVFTGNTALGGGGGISHDWDDPEAPPTDSVITCCTFCGNTAGAGGGVSAGSASPTLTNNIVAENQADTAGGGILYGGGPGPTLSHNDVWGNTPDDYYGCDPGEGDISADPLFANTSVGDVHLTGDSPCVDAGDNSAPDLPEFDWEGDDRVVDGDGDEVAVVDMGADEYMTVYTEAPGGGKLTGRGGLFGEPAAGYPGWVWFSIPLTPDCPVGSGCADPNALLGFTCDGVLWYWDKYLKSAQIYQPPFVTWDLSVGAGYLLYLEIDVPNPGYEGITPFIPCTFEFRLGRQGWTWVGMPGVTELTGDEFMSSVKVKYPSDDTGAYRTAQGDYDAIPDNWVSWGWSFWNTWLQTAEAFTPYSPFGNNTCYPWIGYRVWVNAGAATDADDPDQVTLIWPKS